MVILPYLLPWPSVFWLTCSPVMSLWQPWGQPNHNSSHVSRCRPLKRQSSSQAKKPIYTTQVVRVVCCWLPQHLKGSTASWSQPCATSVTSYWISSYPLSDEEVLHQFTGHIDSWGLGSHRVIRCNVVRKKKKKKNTKRKKHRKVFHCSKYTLILQTKLHSEGKHDCYENANLKLTLIKKKKQTYMCADTHINTNWAHWIDFIDWHTLTFSSLFSLRRFVSQHNSTHSWHACWSLANS